MHLSFDQLISLFRDPLIRKGLNAGGADACALITARTYAMGIHTHAIPPWRSALNKIGKEIQTDAQPEIKEIAPAVIQIDGRQIVPQQGLRTGIEEGMQRAEKYGVAFVGVHSAHWVGALAPYLIECLEKGFAATATAQSNKCEDCPPIGGLDPILSTNPIALAYGTLEDALLADFSTAALSNGKTNELMKKGEHAPDQWFREKDGTWTSDPAAFRQRGGSMAYTGGQHGGHRGFALNLWTECLSVLAGGSAHDPNAEGHQNASVTLYSPAAKEAFLQEMKRFHDLLRENRREDPHVPIRIPGARALASLKEVQQEGIEIDDDTIARINE